MKYPLLFTCLLLIPVFGEAQTASGRTSALAVDVSKDKIKKANLAYLNVSVVDADLTGTLEKNESGFIRFTIRNLGKTSSRPLQIRAYPIEATPGLLVQDTIITQSVGAGKLQQVRIPIRRTSALQPGTYVVAIEIREELLFAIDQLELNVQAEGN